jgi:hypothetical protein
MSPLLLLLVALLLPPVVSTDLLLADPAQASFLSSRMTLSDYVVFLPLDGSNGAYRLSSCSPAASGLISLSPSL